jgi:2-methylisocitrate lyase-like PEP mutase family enzyme
MTDLAAKAATLRGLHHAGTPLILPNIWDAGSARLVAERGFPAIATTSSGVAESLGFSDGENAPAAEIFAAVRRISAAVEVPVTADLESGYGLAPAELVERLLESGAVGLNIEDSDHSAGGLRDATDQADRIAAIKAAGKASGVDIVVNARTDTFLRAQDPAALEAGLERAVRYVAAGADCVYPILLSEEALLRRFVAEAGAPINVLLRPGAPDIARLTGMGVARISLGGGLARVAQAAVAEELSSLASQM